MYIHIHIYVCVYTDNLAVTFLYTLLILFLCIFICNTVTLRYVTEPLGHGFLICSVDNTSIHSVELFWVLNGAVYTKPLEEWLAHNEIFKHSYVYMSILFLYVFIYINGLMLFVSFWNLLSHLARYLKYLLYLNIWIYLPFYNYCVIFHGMNTSQIN